MIGPAPFSCMSLHISKIDLAYESEQLKKIGVRKWVHLPESIDLGMQVGKASALPRTREGPPLRVPGGCRVSSKV